MTSWRPCAWPTPCSSWPPGRAASCTSTTRKPPPWRATTPWSTTRPPSCCACPPCVRPSGWTRWWKRVPAWPMNSPTPCRRPSRACCPCSRCRRKAPPPPPRGGCDADDRPRDDPAWPALACAPGVDVRHAPLLPAHHGLGGAAHRAVERRAVAGPAAAARGGRRAGVARARAAAGLWPGGGGGLRAYRRARVHSHGERQPTHRAPTGAAVAAGPCGFLALGRGGSPALALAASVPLGLLGGLLALLWPALCTVAGRRHHAFGWALAGLFLLVAGFYGDALRGAYPMRWLLALLGLVMVLIIVAMSRISMRIVNNAIEAAGGDREPYLARPPRRNLAILCIVLFTLAEFLQPGGRTSGWLACAAAAALCNLM